MDYVFYQVAGVNGFDSFGHYLRAALLVNQCSSYAVTPVFGCAAKFTSGTATSALASASASGDSVLLNTARALAGKPPVETERKQRRHKTRHKTAPKPSATPTPTPTPAPEKEKADALLDYLFGGDR
jgi:phospholipid/cholesterol/gamma-HCH transport system substrate-binding protein